MSDSPPSDLPLCDLDEIADPGAKSFVVERHGTRARVFVVRRGDEVFGYVNSCPHVGAPLDWDNDGFLDLNREHILCSNHFALFDMETGACLRGPCSGKSLEPFPVIVRKNKVFQANTAQGT